MLKYVYVLLMCFCLSAANEMSETGRKKGNYLLYGGGILYYLTFLIIKVKIIAVVGTLITLALVAGKAFAFYKYIAYIDSHNHPVEPIYTEISHPTPYFNKDVYLDHPPYEVDHSPHEIDHSPHEIDHDHHSYDTIPESHDKSYSNDYSSNYHARKIDDISNILGMTSKIFRGLKVSELAFDAMHIKSDECKRRFLCEASVHAENNGVLSLGLIVLNDTSQDKYRSEENPSTIDECQKMYNRCEEVAQT